MPVRVRAPATTGTADAAVAAAPAPGEGREPSEERFGGARGLGGGGGARGLGGGAPRRGGGRRYVGPPRSTRVPPVTESCGWRATTGKRARSAQHNPHRGYQRRLSVETNNRHSDPPPPV